MTCELPEINGGVGKSKKVQIKTLVMINFVLALDRIRKRECFSRKFVQLSTNFHAGPSTCLPPCKISIFAAKLVQVTDIVSDINSFHGCFLIAFFCVFFCLFLGSVFYTNFYVLNKKNLAV